MNGVKINKPTEVIGMLFQIYGSEPTPELWRECKLAALNEINKNPQ